MANRLQRASAAWVARELHPGGVCRTGSSNQAAGSIKFLATRGLAFREGLIQNDTQGCGCSEEGGEEWNGTVVISGSHETATPLAARASKPSNKGSGATTSISIRANLPENLTTCPTGLSPNPRDEARLLDIS